MAQNCVGEARYPYGTPFSGPREENQSQVRVAQKQPINHVRQLDEEQPLLVNHSSQEERLNDDCIGRIDRLTTPVMCVLLLGEFIAHADTTLIFASAPQIASELGHLRDASWLAAGYTLAVCSTQPLCGKLCDIFGRKPVLLVSYAILSIGCILCGISTSIWEIIAGRVISGVGGAGVMTMASIIITDSVAKRDIAKYRSYINMATTLGRSVGGPLGGVISDEMGWPWLFYLRVPIFAASVLLLCTSLKSEIKDERSKTPLREKLAKVDWIGAFLLSSTIVLFIILIDSMKTAQMSPALLLMIALAGVFANAFVLRGLFVAQSPIFDLRILAQPNVALSYIINYLQVFAQVGMMFSVPLYFQVTQQSSATKAGMRLVPAVVANTAGALLAGKIIQKTHGFKRILFSTGIFGTITYILLILRWNGDTSDAETFYIMPAGIATGMAQSAAFVSMASLLEPSKVSMATGVYFLTSSMGTVTGITTTNLLVSLFFKKNLIEHLPGPGNEKIIEDVVSNIGYISKLQGQMHALVVHAFVNALTPTYILGIGSGVFASFLALLLRQVEL